MGDEILNDSTQMFINPTRIYNDSIRTVRRGMTPEERVRQRNYDFDSIEGLEEYIDDIGRTSDSLINRNYTEREFRDINTRLGQQARWAQNRIDAARRGLIQLRDSADYSNTNTIQIRSNSVPDLPQEHTADTTRNTPSTNDTTSVLERMVADRANMSARSVNVVPSDTIARTSAAPAPSSTPEITITPTNVTPSTTTFATPTTYTKYEDRDIAKINDFFNKHQYTELSNYLSTLYSDDESINSELNRMIQDYEIEGRRRTQMLANVDPLTREAFLFRECLEDGYNFESIRHSYNRFYSLFTNAINQFGGNNTNSISIEFGGRKMDQTGRAFFNGAWQYDYRHFVRSAYEEFCLQNNLTDEAIRRMEGVTIQNGDDGKVKMTIQKNSPFFIQALLGLERVNTDNTEYAEGSGTYNMFHDRFLINGNVVHPHFYTDIDKASPEGQLRNAIFNSALLNNPFTTRIIVSEYLDPESIGDLEIRLANVRGTGHNEDFSNRYAFLRKHFSAIDNSIAFNGKVTAAHESSHEVYDALRQMLNRVYDLTNDAEKAFNEANMAELVTPIKLLNFKSGAEYQIRRQATGQQLTAALNWLNTVYNNQFSAIDLTNTNAYHVWSNSTNGNEDRVLKYITEQKDLNTLTGYIRAAWNNGDTNAAGENSRISFQSAIHGDRLGTYITINPRVNSDDGINSPFGTNFNSKTITVFVEGFFTGTAENSLAQDPTIAAYRKLSNMKINGYSENIPGVGSISYIPEQGTFVLINNSDTQNIQMNAISDEEAIQYINNTQIGRNINGHVRGRCAQFRNRINDGNVTDAEYTTFLNSIFDDIKVEVLNNNQDVKRQIRECNSMLNSSSTDSTTASAIRELLSDYDLLINQMSRDYFEQICSNFLLDSTKLR